MLNINSKGAGLIGLERGEGLVLHQHNITFAGKLYTATGRELLHMTGD